MQKSISYKEIFSMDPVELIESFSEQFAIDMPERVSTASDMERVSQLLIKVAADQVYLQQLLAYAKVAVRQTKRSASSEEWQDMVDRKEVVERFLKAHDDAYAALSRAATIKMANDRELCMNTSGSF